MPTWPQGAQEVLAKLDHHRRSRAELIILANISDDHWPDAIRFLVAERLAIKVGEKRGTRYQKAASADDRVNDPIITAAPNVRSEVSVGYHDVLDEVLRVLDGQSTKEFKCKYLGDDNGHSGHLCLKDILRARGIVRMIDNRHRKGCLWVIDGLGVAAAIEAVTREHGVHFHFKPDGARSTNGLPAWWTKG